jgi:hypothetical protein
MRSKRKYLHMLFLPHFIKGVSSNYYIINQQAGIPFILGKMGKRNKVEIFFPHSH